VAGLVASFGSGAMTNSIDEFEDADCILITGSNTTENHPLIANRILRAQEKGAKVIVIDPRKTQIGDLADIYARQNLGSDVAWLNGLINVIISEGWYDKEFVSGRTEGFEELKAKVADYTPDKIEQISGIPAATIKQIAEAYAKAENGSIVYCMGITQHISGTDNVMSLANLAMVTGNVGKRSTGVNPLRGQNNVQGACDLGALPNVFTGYQAVINDELRAKFEKAWGVKLDGKVGQTIMEMMNNAHDGKLAGMYVMAENPMLSDPDINHVREALENLDFLVVQDIFMTETAQLADVVLPGTTYAEKDGTITNTDRTVQRCRKAIEPIGDSKPDWEILALLGQKMGISNFDYNSPEDVYKEIMAVTPIYAGISYERIENETLHWPCPTADHPGTLFLHSGTFSRGLGALKSIDYREPAEMPDNDYPMQLTTGRMMFHFHTGTMTRNSPALHKEVKESYVEVNPSDAKEQGIVEDEKISIASRRGQIEAKARITNKVGRGVVFIPFHFVEGAANVLTNPALDPVAKIPEYKVCAVKVEKI
jgi:formate dehydrogenase alpha subunit